MNDNDLIRRSAVIDAIRGEREYLIAHKQLGAEHILAKHADAVIDSIPAVDAVEVRHGEWIVSSTEHTFSDGTKARWNIWKCSRCPYVRTAGWEYTTEGQKPKSRYCENCGARMDGRREDGDA